jgi:SWI/SNF-related matrix-associated actin-dependent regulator of chromatin subfamily A member 5
VIKLVAVMDEREEIIAKYIKPQNFDVCVTSFEGVMKCASHLRAIHFKYVVVDEAHKLKNEESLNH